MGNGFPIGGILIHPDIKASFGLLGTTFGGNHLACVACLTVLEVIAEERLMQNAIETSIYFLKNTLKVHGLKTVKGRGLMLGLEFNFPVAQLRRDLLFKHHIFTGGSKNPNLIRILPPLTIQKKHIDCFFDALQKEIN